MNLKESKWLLMPVCLLIGLGLLFSFVHFSQSYLSDHLQENSKELIGKQLEIPMLYEHLQDERLMTQKPSSYTLLFWSVNCAPCLQELPKLQAENPEGLLIPVNGDKAQEKEHARKIFHMLVKDLPFSYDSGRLLQKQFQIQYFPTRVHISADGKVLKVETGAQTPVRI